VAFTVRPAGPTDGAALVALVRGLAEFERLPPPDDEAAERLASRMPSALIPASTY